MSNATITYPSATLPAVPPFTLDLPEGFLAHGSPRAVAVVRPSEQAPGFIPNVTVTADLVPAGSDPDALVETMTTRVGATPTEAEPATDATTTPAPGSATRTLRRDVDGELVHQVATVQVLPTRYAGDLTHALTVVSSWTESQSPAYGEVLRTIHESFRVTTDA